jgi:hypothetical protein
MAEFELDYRLTPDDWRKYRRSYMRRFQKEQRGVFGSQWTVVTVLLAIGLILTILFKLASLGGSPVASPSSAILGFGVGVLTVMIWASSWSHSIERWSHTPEGYVLGPRRLKANEEGVALHGENYEAHYSWRAFEAMTEHPSVTLLWLDRGSAVIVPTRAFGDALVRRAFLELVRRNLGRPQAQRPSHAFA